MAWIEVATPLPSGSNQKVEGIHELFFWEKKYSLYICVTVQAKSMTKAGKNNAVLVFPATESEMGYGLITLIFPLKCRLPAHTLNAAISP